MKYINKTMNNENLGENIFNNLDLSEDNMNKVFNNILNNEQLKSLINFDGNLNSDMISNLFGNLLENNIKDEKLDDDKLKKMEEYFKNVSTDNPDGNILELDDDENDNKSLNNLSEMLFSQINNIKNNIDAKLNEENNEGENPNPINFEEICKLKDQLMNELTDDQQEEIKNLTSTLLSGFGLKQ